MIKHKSFTKTTILILTFIVGLGLALVLPWLASSQIQAAQIEPGEEFSAPEAPTLYYVAITGTGSPGDNWANAFTNVQDALAAASAPAEIWVAKGIYYPDIGSGQINNALTSTFIMTDGVSLIGGFTFGDSDITDQDPENNVTVLSGDIDWDNGGMDNTDGNGVVITTTNIIGDNAYHVVSAKWVTGTAVLDGFTITAGQAKGGSFPHYLGGGYYCDGNGIGNSCSPSLKNIVFSGNLANEGGAMYNNGGNNGSSSPSLTNVTFFGNTANNGGAIFNNGKGGESSPELTYVTFSGNSAKGAAGAMFNAGSGSGDSSPTLDNVIFSGNYAKNSAGAMLNSGESGGKNNPELVNVIFSGNSAFSGGAMANSGFTGESGPILTNVLFSGNFAAFGGAMNNNGQDGECSPFLTNVTFSGNRADQSGAAMWNFGPNGLSNPSMVNSILWDNKLGSSTGTGTMDDAVHNQDAIAKFGYSLVQGSLPGGIWVGGSYKDGGGNIDTDPMFVSPADPSSAPTILGNLRLKINSPAINAGKNGLVTVSSDLDGNVRIIAGTVDMGAYENQSEYPFEDYMPLIFR